MKREFFLKQAKKIKYFVLFILLFLSFCSIQKKVDKKILSKIYVDLLVVEEYYTNPDSIKIKKKEVYDNYKMDKSVYDENLKKFKADQKEWDEFFTLANKYLDSLKANVEPDLKRVN